MLYPEATPTRVKISLDGLWDFVLVNDIDAYDPGIPMENGIEMPVPSAYNDVYEGRLIRDHVGWVAYERYFDVPDLLKSGNLLLRFGSVTHKAKVYLNGAYLGDHKGGFLPFAFDVTAAVLPEGNRLTVLVDNIVDHSTLPCGTLEKRKYPGQDEKWFNFPNFDFFNYSGIMRPVVLYAVPKTYVTDIVVSGTPDGVFTYCVETSDAAAVTVQVLGAEIDTVLWEGTGAAGSGQITDVTPWSPG